MSDKNPPRVPIDRQLTLYQRERNSVWQCAYQVDGKWQRTSTGERDLEQAKKLHTKFSSKPTFAKK